MPFPEISRSIGDHLYPRGPIESLRHILYAGADLRKHEVLIGITWMAKEILVLMIFLLLGVLHSSRGRDIRRVLRKLLAKAFPKSSPNEKCDL